MHVPQQQQLESACKGDKSELGPLRLTVRDARKNWEAKPGAQSLTAEPALYFRSSLAGARSAQSEISTEYSIEGLNPAGKSIVIAGLQHDSLKETNREYFAIAPHSQGI